MLLAIVKSLRIQSQEVHNPLLCHSLPVQDLASVREGQDPLHLHVFCRQHRTDGVVGRRSEPDASANGSDDERILAGKLRGLTPSVYLILYHTHHIVIRH